MSEEITYDNLVEKVFNKCETFLLNEGEQPNTLVIGPKMVSFLMNFMKENERVYKFFGMIVYVSKEVETLDDIEVYLVAEPVDGKILYS